MSVGISVPVGVIVGVLVGVNTGVGSCNFPPMPACRAKYTTAAPINNINTNAPRAAGRLSVISGMRPGCTATSVFFALVSAFAVNSVPHTRQRVAFSVKRVPQVGQTLAFCEEDS